MNALLTWIHHLLCLARPLSRLGPYVLALVGCLVAAAIRHQMGPALGGSIPVVVFTVPVVLASLYGGLGPGVFATLVSAALSTYLFISPQYSIEVDSVAGVVVIGTFLAIGFTISLFGQRVKGLQATLMDQANKLERANQELTRNDQSKDVFLAMLAHELRNPLAGISTAAELLKFSHSDPVRVGRTSEIIVRQVRHMTKLVDDLLDVSRVTRGLVILDKASVDMNEAVQAAVEQLRAAAQAKQQHLRVELSKVPAWVYGDRVRLTQVVGNLTSNAIRYSPSGGSISIQVEVSDESVVLSVTDQGQGIEAALLPSIFDLFVQGARTPDRKQGGLGIGLSLVQKIVQLHEGQVTAHSAGPGTGSRFTVRLPRLGQQAPSSGAQVQTAPPTTQTAAMHVLVVDDNQDAANTIAMLLEEHGHTVSVEYSARGALDRAHQEEFQAVILDIGLPEMDGRELCRRMKKMPLLHWAVFIALSGYGQEADRQQSKEAGFARHLVKPVEMHELLGVLAGRNSKAQAGSAAGSAIAHE